MKIAIVGCTHAGTAAAVNAAKYNPEAEITIYERNDNLSFLSCGIALNIAGIVKNTKELFYSSVEQLEGLGIKANMQHDVLNVDLDNKELEIKNLQTGEVFKDKFDKLIATTGSWPILPKFEGGDLNNILICKNYDHAKEIAKKMDAAKNTVVVGAGYIGVELVEAFEMHGKRVTLIDSQSSIMNKYFDNEFTDVAQQQMEHNGIELKLNTLVERFEGKDGNVTKVVTNNGDVEADLVVLCIGFAPNTGLFKGKIDTMDNGAIIIDENMRTSHPDVYAAGDSCAVIYNPIGKPAYIPLATNAIRMGTIAARNIAGGNEKYIGTQATSGIKIYEYNLAASGLTENFAKCCADIDVETVVVKDSHRAEFMPTYEEVTLKLVYDKNSRVLLGGQVMSKADITQIANTLSICIQTKMTVDELAYVDQFFQPHFNKPWGIINTAGLATKE